MIMQWRHRIILAIVILTLTGCSLLVDRREDVVVYAPRFLPRPSPNASTGVTRVRQLAVAQPQATAPLDGTRIVVMPQPGEIQFYRGARWRESAPMMLQDLLLRAFGDRLNGVAPAGIGVRTDFVLHSDLRDFQAEYRGGPNPIVAISMTAQLVAVANGRIVASRTFTIERPAAGATLAQVFAVFEDAANRLIAEVVDWTIAYGDTMCSEGHEAEGAIAACGN